MLATMCALVGSFAPSFAAAQAAAAGGAGAGQGASGRGRVHQHVTLSWLLEECERVLEHHAKGDAVYKVCMPGHAACSLALHAGHGKSQDPADACHTHGPSYLMHFDCN